MTGTPGDPVEPEVDDSTLIVRRGAAAPADPEPPADVADPEAEPAPRDIAEPAEAPRPDADPLHSAPGLDTETGSTVVVRRESRRRAEAAARDEGEDLEATVAGSGVRPLPPTVAGDVPAPLGRVAHAPTPAHPVYDVRAAPPVIVPRAPTPPSAPQAPFDGAGADAAQRRRSRRRALVVVIAASLVVVAAAAALIALVVAG